MLPLTLGLAVALAPAGADLEWSAPADCPPAAFVEGAAAGLLGRPIQASADTDARIHARGTIVREARGFRLDLEVRSDRRVDRRTLRDRRCPVLAEAAALILATTIDPTLAPIEGPPALPPEPDGTWPNEPVPSVTSDPAPALEAAVVLAPDPERDPFAAPEPRPSAPPVPDRSRASLRVFSLIDQGSLPGPTGGLGLGLGVLRRAWQVDLNFGYLAPRETRPDPNLPPGGRLSLWTAAIRACGVARLPRRLELAGCGAIEAGAMLATSIGVNDVRTRAQPWLAVLVGPELAVRLTPRLAATIGVDAVLPLLRQLFTFDTLGPVFQGNPAAFRGTLGLQLRLP